ncbi:hypothetical protein GCM10010400_58110 [Streptomyces aculeolatus]|uniref:hypothetical protein n=1 Tax=Streptomyces aculeolatus TaxID=270689 RepID=UPI001CEDD27F|nr:hypothetical protein [Streptomyces aculeolatus]
MITVYASKGGTRFHTDLHCKAFHSAHDLWRFDPEQWVPGMPQIMLSDGHPLRETTMTAAFGEGQEPCAVCMPGSRAALYRLNAENDYGHEPVEIGSAPPNFGVVCARCRTDVRPIGRIAAYRLYVPWPCASAVVLGLALREETTP